MASKKAKIIKNVNIPENDKVLVKGLILLISTLVIIFLAFYLFLPIINFQNAGFYFFLAFILSLISLNVLYFTKYKVSELLRRKFGDFVKLGNKTVSVSNGNDLASQAFVSFIGFFSIAIVILIILAILGTPLFNSKRYAAQMEIKEQTSETFKEDFNFDNELLLPILDKELAFKAAQAKLSTYGAQFKIDETNFTILSKENNGKSELIRVTPLEYSSPFVALNKMNEGSIGYIEVNVVTKNAKLVEVKGGMKYLPSALFNKDLDRHIRFKYPTCLYQDTFFEIDDEGNPFWVVPTYKNEIFLLNGKMPSEVILVNPVDGKMNKYKIGEEPKWVDRAIVSSIAESQATNALTYKNGFLNAHFGAKKDVFTVSDGYNYFIKNGRTYYVSCITSPSETDQTSIGFVTVDLKTREAHKYLIPGITEMRAREIAMQHEEVKAQKLTATWPILVNYKGVPSYFLVLKNDVQDRKIVFINVENGLLVALGSNLEEAKLNYDKLINASSNTTDEVKKVNGLIKRVQLYGNDIHFMLEGFNDKYFVVDSNLSIDAHFLKEGDNVEVEYVEYASYNFVKKIKNLSL